MNTTGSAMEQARSPSRSRFPQTARRTAAGRITLGNSHAAGRAGRMPVNLGMRGLLRRSILVGAVLLSLAVPAQAYSVQTHQQLVDLSWKPFFEPLLLARYPGLSASELRKAHAFAYGGCAIQDLGYYPFGDQFFSDLLHYVRSGDFVEAMLRDASSPDELAFALGALSHYIGDSVGHSLAIERSLGKVQIEVGLNPPA